MIFLFSLRAVSCLPSVRAPRSHAKAGLSKTPAASHRRPSFEGSLFLEVFDYFWRLWGDPWASFWLFWVALGSFGPSLGTLGVVLGHFGDLWGALGVPLGGFGGPLGSLWEVLGLLWAALGGFLVVFGRFLARFWAPWERKTWKM